MSELGVIYYAKGTPGAATYVDAGGRTQSVSSLDASWHSSGEFPIGRAESLRLTVQATIVTVASVDIQLVCKRVDVTASGVTWLWEPVMLVPLHTGAPALAPNLLAAAFVTADGTGSALALATTDAHLSGTCKLLVRANGAVAAGDIVIVAGRAQ